MRRSAKADLRAASRRMGGGDRPERKAPARHPGGRNSNCGFSPIPPGAVRQKTACQESCRRSFEPLVHLALYFVWKCEAELVERRSADGKSELGRHLNRQPPRPCPAQNRIYVP